MCEGVGAQGLEAAEKQVAQEALQTAWARVASGFGITLAPGTVPTPAGLAREAGVTLPELKILFAEELENRLSERLGFALDESAVSSKWVRAALVDAVEYQASVSDAANWAEVRERAAKDVDFLSPSQFLRRGGPIRPVQGFCGANLERYNAFFYQTKPHAEVQMEAIVVCPGVSIRALAARELGRYSEAFAKQALTSLLTHESAHPIDSKRQPQMYQQWGNCAQVVKGASGDGSAFPPAKLNELAADHWSAETLASLFETGQVSRQELAGIVAFGSLNYCLMGEKARGTHPDGRFRIDFKGRNARLRQALGCGPAPEMLQCRL